MFSYILWLMVVVEDIHWLWPRERVKSSAVWTCDYAVCVSTCVSNRSNYFNACVWRHQGDFSLAAWPASSCSSALPVSVCVCVYVYRWASLIWSISDMNRQVGLNKDQNTHTHAHIHWKWYNMGHRCRQGPAHSDLCNFFDRAGRKLSFSHTHLHTHTKIARRVWAGFTRRVKLPPLLPSPVFF